MCSVVKSITLETYNLKFAVVIFTQTWFSLAKHFFFFRIKFMFCSRSNAFNRPIEIFKDHKFLSDGRCVRGHNTFAFVTLLLLERHEFWRMQSSTLEHS